MSESASTTTLTKIIGWALLAAAVSSVAYHALTVWVSPHGAMQHYTMHLALVLSVVALEWMRHSTGARTGAALARSLGLAAVCLAAVLLSTTYLYVFAEELELSLAFLETRDVAIGLVILVSIFVLTGVVWGWVLAAICLLAALYFGYGHMLPEPIASQKLIPDMVMSNLTGMGGGPRGIYKYIPLSVDTIFLLIVYGGLLRGALVIDMFAELGKAVSYLLRGGVAYSAIVASSLIGMVTGQAVSNIVLSGSMTIPTMQRRGFTGEQAGAIECLASNGSQFLPPIMGLGAFLMSVILGIAYIDVVTAAILPALLYVGVIVLGLFALIQASPAIPFEQEKVDLRRIAWTLPSFLLSFGVLIGMLYEHYSGGLSGFWGIVIIVLTSLLRPAAYRPSLADLRDGLVHGVAAAAKLGLILAAIGVVAQMLITTGTGIALSQLMIQTSGHSLIGGLLLGMVISLFIGMGLPTPAAYSLIAIVVVPSIIDLGVPALAAHFFGFYFAVYSSLTPPVAVGVLTAVRISGAGFMATARECLKLGGVGLLLPFMFIAYPNLLDFPHLAPRTLVASGLVLLSTSMLATSIYGSWRGRLTRAERLTLLAGPATFLAFLYSGDFWTAAIAPAIFAAFVVQRRRKGETPGELALRDE